MNDKDSLTGDFHKQFEGRKKDHIRLSLDGRNQAEGQSGLNHIGLRHEAFPELNFEDISIEQETLGFRVKAPFLVSSMTAGHGGAEPLNQLMAQVCQARGWLMGVGSQRRELNDENAHKEWQKVRKIAPNVQLLGNIGLSQAILSPTDQIKKLVDSLEAQAMIIHTNPLQECVQPEGTPQFKGGLSAVARLVKELPVSVIVKETGCGFSKGTLTRLKETGVAAVDLSGYGGTHWGRIEGARCKEGSIERNLSDTFAEWGETTVDSLLSAVEMDPNFEVWGSGGVRSGLDGAKLIAMGAIMVGFAQPILQAALEGEESLHRLMETYEKELKTALFCTGSQNLSELRDRELWQILG